MSLLISGEFHLISCDGNLHRFSEGVEAGGFVQELKKPFGRKDVKKFSSTRLIAFLLVFGASIYLVVPPILNAQETGDRRILPNNSATAALDSDVQRPAKSLENDPFLGQRNLPATGQSQAPAKPATVITIPSRNINLGFRLLGTAVIENSGMSLAVIEHEDTGLQEACLEGGRLGRLAGAVAIRLKSGTDSLVLSHQ